MRFLALTLGLLSSSVLVSLSLSAPPPVTADHSLTMPPIHVPFCLREPGHFDLFICARLLTALRNLPYYRKQEIWSEYVSGDGHLPAVFSYQDPSGERTCYLSMDLYEPGIPRTAKERFSLDQVQTDLNNIYFECLKAKGKGGFNRIGYLGNVAAFLGPRLQSLDMDDPLRASFKMLSGNDTDSGDIQTIDLSAYNQSLTSA